MNINELATMTSTPKDTIRVYREKGLLHPARNENNKYFVYGIKDLCTLLFIKKMRYFKLSLTKIKSLLNGSCPYSFLNEYDQQIHLLEHEKQKIQEQINHLKIAKRFLNATLQQVNEISEIEFSTYRYDLYPSLLPKEEESNYDCMLKDSSIYINTIHLTKESLLDESLKELPIHIGLGIDDSILNHYNISIPPNPIVFSPGTYLVTMVRLESLSSLSRAAIAPLLRYADENQFTIIGGITSFLAYIDNSDGAFYYRVRVPVRKIDK